MSHKMNSWAIRVWSVLIMWQRLVAVYEIKSESEHPTVTVVCETSLKISDICQKKNKICHTV
uniref:Secreted protein n=1 Tax=Heterorhabditis bacteriophora TaxID=37862 RepID=A0A1I7W9J5_HETBA